MSEGVFTTSGLMDLAAAERDARESMLTQAEQDLVGKLGSLMGDFKAIMGEETPRRNDMFEVMLHVHALQNMVLAQAGARAFPKMFRLMGEIVDG